MTSGVRESNRKKNKQKLVRYVKSHPFTDFNEMLKNAKVTKNHNSLKKYLQELVESSKIVLVPYVDRYFVHPLPKHQVRNGLFLTVNVMIYEKLLERKIRLTKYKPESYVFGLDRTKSIHEQILDKYLTVWNLKNLVLQTDLSTNLNALPTQARKDIDFIISFGEKLNSFLGESVSKDKLILLGKQLDQHHTSDMEYALRIWKGKRPLSHIFKIAITEIAEDVKEASKTHLALRRKDTSRMRHGRIPKEDWRKFPKKLTSTKNLCSKLYASDGKKPNMAYIINNYNSELGRLGIHGVKYEAIQALLASLVLRNFVNNAPDTPKNKKIKKKIEKVFDKLLSSIS
tara:strand:- start:1358 stop:2386 length:1029 start_codon:yes stop_codon:yes gene_type:complete